MPPLIEQDLFDAVQARLKSRGPTIIHPQMAASNTLLIGILHCAECGGTMTGKSGRYRYYACGNRRRQGETACRAGIVRVDQLDEVVGEYIEDRLLNAARLEVILSALLDRRQELTAERRTHAATLAKKAAEMQQRLNRLYAAIETGIADLGDPEFAERIANLKALRDQAAADAQRAESLLDRSGRNAISREMLDAFDTRARRRLRSGGGDSVGTTFICSPNASRFDSEPYG